ncbi:MAG: serine hydrolase domain-containing protein [Pseudomonadota bacterium]
MKNNASAVGLAVIHQGEIDCVVAFGNLSAEESRELTTRDIFEAASLAKAVTAYGAIKLLSEKGINLDERIDRWLPDQDTPSLLGDEFLANKFDDGAAFSKFKGKDITFRKLMQHISGIQDPKKHGHLKPGEEWLAKQLIELAELKTSGIWRYSNTGYTLLELLLENIAQKPFPQIMDEYALQPLQMEHSTFSQTGKKLEALQWVVGKNYDGVLTTPYQYPRAAGGLRTTARDYSKFMQALIQAYNEKSGNPVKQMFYALDAEGNPCHYGLGIGIHGSPEDPVFAHTGGNNGFSTLMRIMPKRKQGAVILTNYVDGDTLHNKLAVSINNVYEWDQPQSRRTSVSTPVTSIPEADFKQYLGKYVVTVAGGGETVQIEILEEGGQLFLKLPSPTPTSPLEKFPLFLSSGDKKTLFTEFKDELLPLKIGLEEGGARTIEVYFDGCPEPSKGKLAEGDAPECKMPGPA